MRQPDAERIRDMSARLIRPLDGDAGLGGDCGLSGLPWDRTGVGQPFDSTPWRETRSATWVMCWSDLMMTMFILFAAMYAFQVPKDVPLVFHESTTPEAVPVLTAPRPVPADGALARMHDGVRDMIERRHAGAFLRVAMAAGESLHVTVDAAHLFEPGSLILSEEGRLILHDLGGLLQPTAYPLAVTGHAAAGEVLPGADSPWLVASGRAMSVADFMRTECALPSGRLSVVGFGDTRPVTSDDPRVAGDRSRRVEIVVMKSNPAEPVPAVLPSEDDGFSRWLGQAGQGAS